MPAPMVILAIDPSTTKVGTCWANEFSYLGSRTTELGIQDLWRDRNPEMNEAWGRIEQYAVRIEESVNNIKPQYIAFEVPISLGKGSRRLRLLSAIEALTRHYAYKHNVTFIEIHPVQVRATGIHKRACGEAEALLDKSDIGPDEADAIGIWIAALKKIHPTMSYDDIKEKIKDGIWPGTTSITDTSWI
jgi:hypothetical protein